MSAWDSVNKAKKAEAITPEESHPAFIKIDPTKTIDLLKIGLHGQEKTGKTRFVLSAPPPVYVIKTEEGVDPLVRLYPDKEIYAMSCYSPDEAEMFAVEATKSLGNIDYAVKTLRGMIAKDPNCIGTVAIDSVTDVWKWVQSWMKSEILKLDKTARVRQQWDWQYANDKYQNIVMQIVAMPCHVILTGQDKQLYAGPGQPSEEYTPRWQGQTGYWVDIIMGMKKLPDKNGKIHYYGEIEDSRHMNDKLEAIAGTSLENPTFDSLVEVLRAKEKAK
jgi:hypothetical protein